MEDPLFTVRSLIALSFSMEDGKPTNEAKSAALQACRLIHAHGLLKGDGAGHVAAPPGFAPGSDATARSRVVDFIARAARVAAPFVEDAADRVREEIRARAEEEARVRARGPRRKRLEKNKRRARGG